MNTYGYVYQNPLKYTDIYGLDTTGNSGNPNKPKVSIPNAMDIICAGVSALCSLRDDQLNTAESIHEKNMSMIEKSCNGSYMDCSHIDDFLDRRGCIKSVMNDCSSQRNSEIDRYLERLRKIDEQYRIETELENMCK